MQLGWEVQDLELSAAEQSQLANLCGKCQISFGQPVVKFEGASTGVRPPAHLAAPGRWSDEAQQRRSETVPAIIGSVPAQENALGAC
jgi:hypothetical protein